MTSRDFIYLLIGYFESSYSHNKKELSLNEQGIKSIQCYYKLISKELNPITELIEAETWILKNSELWTSLDINRFILFIFDIAEKEKLNIYTSESLKKFLNKLTNEIENKTETDVKHNNVTYIWVNF
jgi:ABC-type molybdate transport system substrate-binding protein